MLAGEEASFVLLKEELEDQCPSTHTLTDRDTHIHTQIHTHTCLQEASFMLFKGI